MSLLDTIRRTTIFILQLVRGQHWVIQKRKLSKHKLTDKLHFYTKYMKGIYNWNLNTKTNVELQNIDNRW